jgi:hypothetical protein
MNDQRAVVQASTRIVFSTLSAITLMGILVLPWSDSRAQAPPPFAVNFHAISYGGKSLHNSCFHLSGTVGQAAPGYSSNASDSIYAGFWSAAPTTGLDELFFNSFEGC